MPNDDLACARAESAALLNLDPDKLSPADALGTLAFGQHEDRSFMMSRTII